MPRVTLETLPDYARYLITAAESAAKDYPATRKVQLPRLELTAHVGPGLLADALGHAFVEAAQDRAGIAGMPHLHRPSRHRRHP